MDGRLRFEHDFYMKMWAMSEPVLPADFILLDDLEMSLSCSLRAMTLGTGTVHGFWARRLLADAGVDPEDGDPFYVKIIP
ncbi:hypothetical protein ACGF13_22040 [Kitasatospora sp. NPDC048286]|uniref:hypothetical protein n=1 Tax=unclassified Kitasatospora TaxID=2633591 RepID=UPI00371CAFF6